MSVEEINNFHPNRADTGSKIDKIRDQQDYQQFCTNWKRRISKSLPWHSGKWYSSCRVNTQFIIKTRLRRISKWGRCHASNYTYIYICIQSYHFYSFFQNCSRLQVKLLMRVHDNNLVSFIGYCDEGDTMALVYEYIGNGKLQQKISGAGIPLTQPIVEHKAEETWRGGIRIWDIPNITKNKGKPDSYKRVTIFLVFINFASMQLGLTIYSLIILSKLHSPSMIRNVRYIWFTSFFYN